MERGQAWRRCQGAQWFARGADAERRPPLADAPQRADERARVACVDPRGAFDSPAARAYGSDEDDDCYHVPAPIVPRPVGPAVKRWSCDELLKATEQVPENPPS